MSVTNTLYRIARLAADVRALRSPETAARRIQNRLVGRALGRAGDRGSTRVC